MGKILKGFICKIYGNSANGNMLNNLVLLFWATIRPNYQEILLYTTDWERCFFFFFSICFPVK